MKIRFNCPVGTNNNWHEHESTQCIYCKVDKLNRQIDKLLDQLNQKTNILDRTDDRIKESESELEHKTTERSQHAK